MATAP